jgi:N-methylhydantoinase A
MKPERVADRQEHWTPYRRSCSNLAYLTHGHRRVQRRLDSEIAANPEHRPKPSSRRRGDRKNFIAIIIMLGTIRGTILKPTRCAQPSGRSDSFHRLQHCHGFLKRAPIENRLGKEFKAMDNEKYIIGVDTGGTFTDCVVMDTEGNISFGKAETTPEALENGVLNAIEDAAKGLGLDIGQLLSQTRAVNQGTTIGTNILINRNGAKIGLITTKGFEDTIYIQRAIGRVDGLSPEEIRHAAVCRKPEPLVPKELIIGVTERIDCFGKVVIPLNLAEVEEAVDRLKTADVDAIGISLLWGFMNPIHEVEIEKIIKKKLPAVYCQLASRVAPSIREYGRSNTVVIDTYVGPPMIKWYRKLKSELEKRGYRHELLTMQVWGGVMPAKSMIPMGTINSGPAGGVIGGRLMAKYLDIDNVVTTDVGGTSFDVSVVIEGKPIEAREPPIMRYRVSIPMIEISSIGAGGGSIAWVDPAGSFKVGPMSAGSLPGPVCYRKGGTNPTVADADLVLGYLNPDYFLGGKISLDRDASIQAIKKLGERMGWGLTETAVAIFQIQNEHMADLMRLVITRRGYDPREFSVFAFGGGGGIHGVYYSLPLGVKSIYMFNTSSVFSAFGICTSDIQRVYGSSVYIRLPGDNEAISKLLTQTYKGLEENAFQELSGLGFRKEDVIISRSINMKFGRQVNMESIEMQVKDYAPEDVADTTNRFVEYYTKIYGEGAAFVGAGVEIMTQSVTASIKSSAAPPIPAKLGSTDPSTASKGERPVYFMESGDYVSTRIYDFALLKPGNVIKGPAITEARTTTFVIPPGQSGMINEYGQLFIDLSEK